MFPVIDLTDGEWENLRRQNNKQQQPVQVQQNHHQQDQDCQQENGRSYVATNFLKYGCSYVAT